MKRLDIDVYASGGTRVAAVRGEVDGFSAPELAALTSDGGCPLVVDLSGVTFCDSAGVRAIVEVTRAGATVGRVSPQVQRILELAGLDGLLLAERSDGGAATA